MINKNEMSANAWEFIRQCKEERKFPTFNHILQEAARLTNEGNPRYANLHVGVMHIASANSPSDRIYYQREMVRELALEMLGKILYTQREFADKLIALMNEFGVAVAIVERVEGLFEKSPHTYVVTVYAPTDYGSWGGQHHFETEVGANLWASHVNRYGTFDL